jgi:altronate dehydratase small subunit
MSRCFQVHPADNVATLLAPAEAGATLEVLGSAPRSLVLREAVALGHKVALGDIAAGEPIIKFGARIGHATQPIARGTWVHLHNLASNLDLRSGTFDGRSGAPTDTSSAYA